MKKSILLMVPFAMGLAACSGSSPLDKGNIISEAFMERNFTDVIESTKEETFLEKVTVDYGEGMAYSVRIADWEITVNGEGTSFGAYNVVSNKYDVAPAAFDANPFSAVYALGEFDPYETDPLEDDYWANNTEIVYLSYVTVSEEVATRHFVDVSGEEVFAMETSVEAEASPELPAYMQGSAIFLSYFEIDPAEREGNEYCGVYAFSGLQAEENRFVVYNIDDSISRKGKVSEFEVAVGSLYGHGSLAAYGHPELSMVISTDSTRQRYSVFNKEDGKFISSFEAPANATYFVAGDFIVYQYKVRVEDRATTYDFYDGTTNAKYDVVTFRINYTNGAREELESKVIFEGGYPEGYCDEKGVYKYGFVEEAQIIAADKTLDPETYSFLLDEKAEVVADVTGIPFGSLEKVGDKYVAYVAVPAAVGVYNLYVYDGKLNEVAYIPYVDVSGHIFESGSGYGLVGFDGKVLLQPVANEIQHLGKEHYYVQYFDKTQLVEITEAGELKVLKEFALEEYVPCVNMAGNLIFAGALDVAGYYGYAITSAKVLYADAVEADKMYFVDFETGEVAPADYGVAETDVYDGYYFTTFRNGSVRMAAVYETTAEGAYYAVRDIVKTVDSFHSFEEAK